jgi:hypothetical protein
MPPAPHRPRRLRLAALAVAACLLGATVATVGAAYHTGKETVHREAVEGAGAFGVAADLEDAGDLELVLNAYGEQRSSLPSHGVVLYDQDGDPRLMIVVTLLDPPDRLEATVEPGPGATAVRGADPGDVDVDTYAAPGVVDEVDATIHVDRDADATDGEPTARTFLNYRGLDPGTQKAILWIGDFEATELEVQTNASLDDVRTHAGTAHVAGDADLEGGTANVQAQDSFVGGSVPLEDTSRIGTKAMLGPSYELDAEDGLYGIWTLVEQRRACGPLVDCAEARDADEACRSGTGVAACGPGSISWRNEQAAGTGEHAYSFWKSAPGAHAFTVDHKVDAFEAGYGPATWGEQHSILSVADVRLPG